MIETMEIKSLRSSKKALLSAAIVQKRIEKHPFVEWLKNRGNRIVILSDEKTFTVDPVYNKQNDRVVKIRNDVFEHRRMSTTKHPASIVMPGVIASNGEKILRFDLNGATG